MTDSSEVIAILYRTEYSKLVAVLCKSFGLANIRIAEDIASDTFLQAAEKWKTSGLPKKQVAWLYTVAKNKVRDHLRREKIRIEKVEPNLNHDQDDFQTLSLDFSIENISDSVLRMMFALCHPVIDKKSQIILALRILCGFNVDEIAKALLSNKEAIIKRLFRAKKVLRTHKIDFEFPSQAEVAIRLDTILTTLYLLFNEGYYSASHQKSLRKDLCLEAIRLTLLLVENPLTGLPRTNALLALMCFHASRFDARSNKGGGFILYENQDRSLWEKDLIEKGEYYLNQSASGADLSKYHLEAAIAFWHTQDDQEEKWENILQLFNVLLQIEYSPIAALNRTYALARARSREEGLLEAKNLKLDQHHLYHCLLAELSNEKVKIMYHLERALTLATSEIEKELIAKKMENCQIQK